MKVQDQLCLPVGVQFQSKGGQQTLPGRLMCRQDLVEASRCPGQDIQGPSKG